MSAVVNRIRKFLEMSKSDNENEATMAAQRAAEMMAKYNITEAELRVEDETREAEPIVQREIFNEPGKPRKRVAWKELIADGVAKSLGCHLYLTADGPAVFGRESATQAWKYTCLYLFNEVNRLAEEAWEREGSEAWMANHTPKKWKNSFRVGAAQSIIMRLYEEADKRGVPETSEKALMIINDDEKEVENEYAKFSSEWGKSSMIGLISNRTGYKAGLEAGHDMELNGASGALPEGMKSLVH